MAVNSPWLSLTDLGRIFGISATHFGRLLHNHGWLDRLQRPTPAALDAGAASSVGPHGQGRAVLWNRDLCSALLIKLGYSPVSRSVQVEQWTQLLEALQLGSPAIAASLDQMAEEIPNDLVDEVNQQLTMRGCRYRVSPHNRSSQHRATPN